jgi:predicted RNA binding protein YcfA (HicA-like mRNA interferase family)
MVKEQATRAVVKELRAAGFTPDRTVGSHTMWVSEDGKVHVSVPDGHRAISPGVYRKVLKALKEAGK